MKAGALAYLRQRGRAADRVRGITARVLEQHQPAREPRDLRDHGEVLGWAPGEVRF